MFRCVCVGLLVLSDIKLTIKPFGFTEDYFPPEQKKIWFSLSIGMHKQIDRIGVSLNFPF